MHYRWFEEKVAAFAYVRIRMSLGVLVQISISVSPANLRDKVLHFILFTISEFCVSRRQINKVTFSFFPLCLPLFSSPIYHPPLFSYSPLFSGFIVIQWTTWEHSSSPRVPTCTPLCAMAFYSYVMMKNVRVGVEAILHVVREQQDRSVTDARAPRCLLGTARGD